MVILLELRYIKPVSYYLNTFIKRCWCTQKIYFGIKKVNIALTHLQPTFLQIVFQDYA